MKISPGIWSVAFCALFLTWAPWDPAGALTFSARTKEVSIDADWRVTGRYAYQIRIMDVDDARQVQRFLQHLTGQQTDRIKILSTGIRLPDGRQMPWDNDAEAVPADATIDFAFEISAAFPGFEGLFADYMDIDQAIPLEKAAYRITFPEKTAFIWRVVEEDKSLQNTSDADFFSWSGTDVNRLKIMISTAESWDQIAGRYETHFQKKLTDGLAGTAFPGIVKTMDKNSGDAEKTQAVIGYLRTEMDYRVAAHPENGLFPNEPAVVLQRGRGDCKDIALLGAAMLQAMDMDAFVVLTGSPRLFSGESDPLPDPFIFNHAFIGITENGRPSYYDVFHPAVRITPEPQHIYLHLKVSAYAGR